MRRNKSILAFGLAVYAMALLLASYTYALEVGGDAYTQVRSLPDEQYNFSITVLSDEEGRRLSGFDLVFAADDEGRGYRISQRNNDVRLDLINGGAIRRLAQGRLTGRATQRDIEVRRRRNTLSVLIDGEEILWTLNADLSSGAVGIAPHEHPITVRNWRYQTISDITFSDDFLRVPGEDGPWKALVGRWLLRTTRESETAFAETRNREIDPDRSSNFYAFTGLVDSEAGYALAATGHDFWDSYRISAAVQSAGGPIGLAFFVRDEKNFYVARWWLMSKLEENQPLEIVRVVDGREIILGRVAVKGAVDQWYHMEVAAPGRNIRVIIDGHTVMDVEHDGWATGLAGLYHLGADDSIFDDITVATEREWLLDTGVITDSARSEGGGNWLRNDTARTGHANETQRFVFNQTDPNGSGIYWLGDFEWSNYAFSADLKKNAGAGAVGMVLREGRDGRSLIFRTGGAPAREGVWSQLVLRHPDGRHDILAEGPGGPFNGESIDALLDLSQPGLAEVYVDGKLWLRSPHPLSGGLRPGFYTLGGGGEFANPKVDFGVERESGATVTRDTFAQDRFMAGWASDRWSWIGPSSGRQFWHQSDFYGRFEMDIPLAQGPFTVYIASEEQSVEDCYALAFRPFQADKPAHVELSRRGVAVAEAEVAATRTNNTNIALVRDGHYIIVAQGGEELFAWRDDEPLTGSSLGMNTAEPRLHNMALMQYNVKDYLFQESPTDWKRTGTWEITTRFTCDPRWSWMGATEWEGLAAIWNKYQFAGDVTVEFYAGMRMAAPPMTNYPRPGEINVTLGASREDLNSGYSAIITAWDRLWLGRWSYLKRGDHVVAATDRELVPLNRLINPRVRPIPVEWDPGGRPLHGAWYNVRLRRSGDIVRAFFDNVQVLQYRDPAPLDGGLVALWTQHNSIMVARVRIAYENAYLPPPEVKALPVAGSARMYAALDPDDKIFPDIELASVSHPGVFSDFENGFGGWSSVDDDQGAYLTLTADDPGSGNRSLRIVNRRGGGTFGAALKTPNMRALYVSEFDFLYKVDPETKVNFYMNMGGRRYFVQFTGPDESLSGLVKLGRIENVKADGEWHRASFPLASSVARWAGDSIISGDRYENNRLSAASLNEFRFDGIRIGNYHEGYLKAGFGGNPAGASLWLDDFRIVSSGGPITSFVWNPASEDAAYAYSFTMDAPAVPANPLEPQTGLKDASRRLDEPGLWYFNLCEFNADGKPKTTRHLPFHVDNSPLKLSAVQPADGGTWGGGPVRVAFETPGDAVMGYENIRLRINGQSVGFPSAGFRVDWENFQFVIDLNRLANTPRFSDGDEVSFALNVPRFSGPATYEWSHVYSLEADKTPPSRVIVKESPYRFDFENGITDAIATDNTAALLVDPRRDGRGNAMRVLAHQVRSPMAVELRTGTINAAQYPVLAFDYKIESGVPIDITIYTGAGNYQVRFTDVDEVELAGRVSNVVADGSWRRAELNLHQILSSQQMRPNLFEVRMVRFSDTGHTMIAPGTAFHLDNIEFVPVISSSPGFTLSWEARDASGIAGYSYLWSDDPDAEPDENIDTEAASQSFNDLVEGKTYFHIRAVDKAGNVGPAATYRFIVDNTPPVISALTDDNNLLTETLRMRVESRGPTGLDFSQAALIVNGEKLEIDPAIQKIDERRSELAWHWARAIEEHRPPVADGTAFRVEITGIRDSAGNAAESKTLELKVDYATDQNPPAEPFVAGGGLLTYDNFTRGVDEWRAHQPGSATDIAVVEKPDGGSSLEITNRGNASFGVYTVRRPYRLDEYPWLSFDYRFPADIPTHIVANVDGRVYSIKLTEHRNGYVLAGEVEGFTADDQWRHLRINLHDMIREHHGDRRGMQVRWMFIGNMINRSSPAKLYIDNFAIYSQSEAQPKMSWFSYDVTGIAGYSFVIDDQNVTLPNEEIDAEGPEAELGTLEPGDWYLHIRARDGAGNWGPASHIPIHVPAQE